VWEGFGIDGWWDSEHRGFDAMGEVFVLLACHASFDVFCDPGPGTRPKVFSIDASDCFVSSGMAIDRTFMSDVH
jgi:hypothetical protein